MSSGLEGLLAPGRAAEVLQQEPDAMEVFKLIDRPWEIMSIARSDWAVIGHSI